LFRPGHAFIQLAWNHRIGTGSWRVGRQGEEAGGGSTGCAMVCYGVLWCAMVCCACSVFHTQTSNLKPQTSNQTTGGRGLCAPAAASGPRGSKTSGCVGMDGSGLVTNPNPKPNPHHLLHPTPYLAWLLPRLQEGRLQLPFRICCDNPASLVRGSAPANGRAVGSVATKGPETACGLRNIFYDG